MSVISYRNQKIIPAPFVNITKSYERDAQGKKIGATFTITLTSKIVAFMGSPNSSSVFHTGTGYPADEVISDNSRLAAVLRKIESVS